MDAPVITPKRPKVSLGSFTDMAAKFGRPMMAVGLVLVLLSRGCDVIGERGVEKARANVASASLKATAGYDKDIRRYDQKIKNLKKAEKPDTKAIDDAKDSRREDRSRRRTRRMEKFQTETLPRLAVRGVDGVVEQRVVGVLARVGLRPFGDRPDDRTDGRQCDRRRGRAARVPDHAGDHHLQHLHRRRGLDGRRAVLGTAMPGSEGFRRAVGNGHVRAAGRRGPALRGRWRQTAPV